MASNQGQYRPPLDSMKGSGATLYKVSTKWLRYMDFRDEAQAQRSRIVLIP